MEIKAPSVQQVLRVIKVISAHKEPLQPFAVHKEHVAKRETTALFRAHKVAEAIKAHTVQQVLRVIKETKEHKA